jgi:RimJ/RimL family protein N-acetyltransferase
MTVFATERLDVTPWSHDPSDVERLLDTYSRWEVAQWLGATPRALASLDEARGAVDRWAARSTVEGYGVWSVRRRSDGFIVGTVLLVPLPSSESTAGASGGEVEVGWHLHPDSWGQGYATEAARGALGYGFGRGLTEIYAVVRPGNERSLAVCRRLGMTPLGRTERWYGTELEAFRVTTGELLEKTAHSHR